MKRTIQESTNTPLDSFETSCCGSSPSVRLILDSKIREPCHLLQHYLLPSTQYDSNTKAMDSGTEFSKKRSHDDVVANGRPQVNDDEGTFRYSRHRPKRARN